MTHLCRLRCLGIFPEWIFPSTVCTCHKNNNKYPLKIRRLDDFDGLGCAREVKNTIVRAQEYSRNVNVAQRHSRWKVS